LLMLVQWRILSSGSLISQNGNCHIMRLAEALAKGSKWLSFEQVLLKSKSAGVFKGQ